MAASSATDLRLAVAHAVSKDFITQFPAPPGPEPAHGLTSVQSSEGTRTYPHDLELAKGYVESGAYDGTPVKIIYDVADPYQAANSTALKQDLEAVGFTVDLQGLQTGEFFTAVYNPKKRDISSTYWSADYPDAQDYISTNFVCGAFLNISHFCGKAIDTEFFATEAMALGAERRHAQRHSSSSTRWQGCRSWRSHRRSCGAHGSARSRRSPPMHRMTGSGPGSAARTDPLRVAGA
jgi:ABC-type transport system substrate-binding protein